jgi:hypothetical protein
VVEVQPPSTFYCRVSPHSMRDVGVQALGTRNAPDQRHVCPFADPLSPATKHLRWTFDVGAASSLGGLPISG